MVSVVAAEDVRTDMIDTTGLSLKDVEGLPDSALTSALREALTSNGTGTSAGFSSRLGKSA